MTQTLKKIATTTALTAALLTMPAAITADGCTTQYGGSQYGTDCPPTDVVINKEVKHPVNRTYVENLGTSDVLYAPENEVQYRLTVKNAGNQDLTDVLVTDILPPYLSYTGGGPSGTTYNAADRTITFTIAELKAGETKTFELDAQVDSEAAFPSGHSVFCVVNTARVEKNGYSDEDTAQICIQADVLGASTLPVAGAADMLMLIPFGTIGGAGIALLKKRK